MNFDFQLYQVFIYDILQKALLSHEEEAQHIFQIKWIHFFNRQIGILIQAANGPCPLIAITNSLALRNEFCVKSTLYSMTLGEVVYQLTAYLLKTYKTMLEDPQDSDFISSHIEDAVKLLPQLNSGLNVNCKFDHPKSFELTSATSLFDVFKIELFHGWIVSPEDENTYTTISSLSYNQLVEKVINIEASYSTPENTQTEIENLNVSDSLLNEIQNEKKSIDSSIKTNEYTLIVNFLEETKSQLTMEGLMRLHEEIQEYQIAVLFRNNHFSTIFRYHGEIFLLASYQLFIDIPYIVWEKLDMIDGDTTFYNQNFISSEISNKRIEELRGPDNNLMNIVLTSKMKGSKDKYKKKKKRSCSII